MGAAHLSGPLYVGGVPVQPQPMFSPFAKHYFVHGNDGNDSYLGTQPDKPFKTLDRLFDDANFVAAGAGSIIHVLGNISEHLISPTGVPDVTIIGHGPRPRHADTHPLNGEVSAMTWKSAGTASALLTLRNPGWRFINILFAAHASHPSVLMERNAIEDATEQDSSHAQFLGCRFASGGYGIRDTGGTFNVLVAGCHFQAVTECILGVGNIGVGQLGWEILNNRFTQFTNGVKIAGHECRIQGNTFQDGGTPNTTYVLNTNNGGGRDNFVVGNFLQGTTANFNTPDVVGCSTDVWLNHALDTAAAGTSGVYEIGQPA